MGLFSFLNKETNLELENPLIVDLHSHLIFDVDDGSKSIENSIELISGLSKLGYKKLITTPHIMGDFYRNSKENLFPKRDIIREELKKNNINIQFECAAEYYLDESLISKLKSNENLLTFGDNYVLFETSFMNKPNQLYEVIFDLLANGYKPILAHPERYLYLHETFEHYQELKEKGVLFQMNINSINGYYSKPVKKIAEKLISEKMINFLGSDCHNIKHVDNLEKTFSEKYFKKAMTLPLLNNSLL